MSSERNNGPHFVWVHSMCGPQPQKWGELFNGYKRDYLTAHPITVQDFVNLSIDELALKYPAPKVREES